MVTKMDSPDSSAITVIPPNPSAASSSLKGKDPYIYSSQAPDYPCSSEPPCLSSSLSTLVECSRPPESPSHPLEAPLHVASPSCSYPIDSDLKRLKEIVAEDGNGVAELLQSLHDSLNNSGEMAALSNQQLDELGEEQDEDVDEEDDEILEDDLSGDSDFTLAELAVETTSQNGNNKVHVHQQPMKSQTLESVNNNLDPQPALSKNRTNPRHPPPGQEMFMGPTLKVDPCAEYLNVGRKRSRTIMTPYQSRILRRVLESTAFPSTELRENLAKMLGMKPRTVQIWFQNQRQKAKQRIGTNMPSSVSMTPLMMTSNGEDLRIRNGQGPYLVPGRIGNPNMGLLGTEAKWNRFHGAYHNLSPGCAPGMMNMQSSNNGHKMTNLAKSPTSIVTHHLNMTSLHSPVVTPPLSRAISPSIEQSPSMIASNGGTCPSSTFNLDTLVNAAEIEETQTMNNRNRPHAISTSPHPQIAKFQGYPAPNTHAQPTTTLPFFLNQQLSMDNIYVPRYFQNYQGQSQAGLPSSQPHAGDARHYGQLQQSKGPMQYILAPNSLPATATHNANGMQGGALRSDVSTIPRQSPRIEDVSSRLPPLKNLAKVTAKLAPSLLPQSNIVEQPHLRKTPLRPW